MELLDIVDEYGIPTGQTVKREEAHMHGTRHRTSHVWLFRVKNGVLQVLLQKRSLDKDSYPGCYDISSAGHIPAGSGFLESALRELKEELGVEAEANELVYCGQRRFEIHEVFHEKEFWDNQISNIYVLQREAEASEFKLQMSEVDTVLWTDWDLCVDMVRKNKAPHCIWMEELEMIAQAFKGSSKCATCC
jgi:Isopentenyldiphosphate isomerase